ncbi:sensor histidine kinase, partial [Bacteroidota bacterium]
YASEATAKGVKLVVENELINPFPVPLENVQLIFRNLIGNAIKYSNPNSEVRITLKEKEGKTVCEVADQGIGIKQEDLAKIFNPFYRSDAMDHRSISGNGLGLAISQRAARAIKADISVKSELGSGSTFALVF